MRLRWWAALAVPLLWGGLARAGTLEEAFDASEAGDYAKAAALYRIAAESGNPVGQYSLGRLYEAGQGVPKDYALAAGWLRKAAERGDAKAQNELGVLLASGRGLPRDREAALGWFRLAAEQGNADARLNLADLLREPKRSPSTLVLWALGLAALTSAVVTLRRREAPVDATVSPEAAPAGLSSGRYRLGGRIGEGGMGVVLEGHDRVLDRRVAVKMLRSELRTRPEERDRFVREAKIVAQLTHPFIVGVYDVVDDGRELYLVLEFIDGKPLSRILEERRRLPLSECVPILDHVCQAVSSAHRAEVLHRDLKPSNVMVDADGFAKVMDFGLARQAKESISRLTAADASGTPAYMAPEQHLGHARRASDVYSLGVCLYEMLTGELPFQGPDFLAQKERLKYAPATFLLPALPKGLDALLSATLVPKPEDRIEDPLVFLERLRSVSA